MHLGAHVLLPDGFDNHPEAKFPLMIFGHFQKTLDLGQLSQIKSSTRL